MRVTSNSMNYNYLSDLNKTLERRAKAQSLLDGDGKALQRPSDDPIKVVRSLRFNVSLEQNNMYTQNVQDADSWMKSTDGYMQQLSSIMIDIKGKVVQASDGTNPQAAVQTIGVALDNLINQIVNIGNAQEGGRYIFAGLNDKTNPFSRVGDSVAYYGDEGKISMPIAPGVANPNEDSVNLTGSELFGEDLQILKDLIEIKDRMMSGTPEDVKWLSSTGLVKVDSAHDHMLQSLAALGGRMSMYEMSKTMLAESNAIIVEDKSLNEDVDIPKAMLEFTAADNVYNASLSMGAKVLPRSLVDFL